MRTGRVRPASSSPRTGVVPGLTDRPPAVAVSVAAVAAVGLSVFGSGLFGWTRAPGVTRFLGIQPTSRAAALVLGALLLVLARGLAGRRAAAHRVLVVVLAVAAWGALTGQHDLRRAGVLAVVIVAFVLVHDRFSVAPDAHRVRFVALAGAGILLATVAGTSGWMIWRTPNLHHRAAAAHAAEGALGGFVGLSGVVERALPTGPDPAAAMVLAGGLTAIIGLLIVLAPRSGPGPATAEDHVRAAALTALPGNDTFAPFALRYDKAYAFSADHRAAVGYRVLFGAAVVGGDPIGAEDSFAAAVRAFLELCARQGWRPMVIGARADRAALWTDLGLHAVGIGDEVVVDLAGFTLHTPALRNVRQAVKRTHNLGVTTELLRERDLDATLHAELVGVMQRCWGGTPERGFSMNLDAVLTGLHGDALLVVCRDANGHAVAFQRYVVCSGGSALSLDTMCRCPGSPNGVNERMIIEAMGWGNEHGVTLASLNFAAFRPVFDAERRSALEATGYRLIHLLDRWIKLESLYQFNAKFRPRWVPRSVVLRAWTDLPALLPAALAAEFGGPLDFRRPRTEDLAALAAAAAGHAEPGAPATTPDGLAHGGT